MRAIRYIALTVLLVVALAGVWFWANLRHLT